jgi:hypothetical protein
LGRGVTYPTFQGGKEKILYPVLNVPRQCPLALLVEVNLRKDKALGSDCLSAKLQSIGLISLLNNIYKFRSYLTENTTSSL